MDALILLHGLRFIDSFFPSGGFAFSSGLEAAVQDGAVRNAEDLSRYVTDLLWGGLGTREGVAARLGHRAAVTDRLDLAISADRELDAMKLGREGRLASRQMGRHMMKTGDDGTAPAVLRRFARAVEEGRTPGHVPVCLGVLLGVRGWGAQETVAAFLYHSVTGLVSAALRLLPMGQQEAQRLLTAWLPVIEAVSRRASTTRSMASRTPLHDIYGMRHGRLEWRLFRS
jgi:urease accessory protein